MQLSVDGVTYGLALWPSAVAAAGAALCVVARIGAPALPPPPPPSEEEAYRLKARPLPRARVPVWAGALHLGAILAMLKPLALAGIGYGLKVSHFAIADRFFPVLLLDAALLWLSGHLLCSLAARRRAWPSLLGLAGFALAGAALLQLWSTDRIGDTPRLDRHACALMHEGQRCALRVPGEDGWQRSLRDVRSTSKGEQHIPVRFERWPGWVAGSLRVVVGEDRGHPLFAPRVGDRWFYLNDDHDPKRLGYRDLRELGEHIGMTTMTAQREEVRDGRRFVLLQMEVEKAGERRTSPLWLSSWDGGTFVVEEEDGHPNTSFQGQEVVRELDEHGALLEPLGSLPRGEHMGAFTMDGPLNAQTVMCYFLLLPGKCRCQRGPLPRDPRRTLPGPVACRGSIGVGKGLLTVLSLGMFNERAAVVTLHESGPVGRR